MVGGRPVLARLEEVHRVQVRDVDSPRVGGRALAAVLLECTEMLACEH